MRRIVGLSLVGWSLACTGFPAAEDAPPSAEVQELLDAELDGETLDAEQQATRELALQSFLAANPEFGTWKTVTLECLDADCAPTVEAAYGRVRADFESKAPPAVTVTGDPWRVLVVVDQTYTPSEDWSAFSDQMQGAFPADQVATTRAGFGVYQVSVQEGGAEVATIDLNPFLPKPGTLVGYVVAKEGAEAQWIAHEMPTNVIPSACAALGIEPCPSTTGEPDEAEEPPPEEGKAGKGPGERRGYREGKTGKR